MWKNSYSTDFQVAFPSWDHQSAIEKATFKIRPQFNYWTLMHVPVYHLKQLAFHSFIILQYHFYCVHHLVSSPNHKMSYHTSLYFNAFFKSQLNSHFFRAWSTESFSSKKLVALPKIILFGTVGYAFNLNQH